MNIGGYLSADFLSAGKASVVTRAVGTFHFDVVTAEEHTSTLRVTTNPIESGGVIADHAALEPKGVTITAVMVGYEPPNYAGSILGVDMGMLDKLPLPMNVSAVTNQALSMANRYISMVDSIADSATRMIAPFVPSYLGFAADESATLDRVGKAYNELLNIQKSGEMLTVQTGIKLYEDMMLLNIGITQTSDSSAEFRLTLGEIHISESQTAAGISPDQQNAQPKTTQMGKTQPKEESSALRDIFT